MITHFYEFHSLDFTDEPVQDGDKISPKVEVEVRAERMCGEGKGPHPRA